MMNWGLTDVEVLACFFLASAALVLIGLKMIIGPSPQKISSNEATPENTCPRRLAAVEDEGYQVVELYNDPCALDDWLRGSKHRPMSSFNGDAVRTAKVRDPESGEIKLLQVLDRVGRYH